jgi:hypothetical protein
MKQLLFLFLILSTQLHATSVSKSYTEHVYESENVQQFLKDFPFQDYLKTVSLMDLEKIHEEKQRVQERFGNGDAFLFQLVEHYLHQERDAQSDFESTVRIGEHYLLQAKIRPKGRVNTANVTTSYTANDPAYALAGYYILGSVAQRMELEHRTMGFDIEAPQHADLIKRLHRNKVYVSFIETNSEKIQRYVFTGDLAYVWNRACLEALPLFRKVGALLWLIVVLLAVPLFTTKWHWGLKLIPLLSAILLIAMKLSASSISAPSPFESSIPNYRLETMHNLYVEGEESAVNIFEIKDKLHNLAIGQAIWMKADKVKPTYISKGDVHHFKKNIKPGVVLATTGGYATHDGGNPRPDGFTMQDGEVLNAVLLPDRHGLVVITNSNLQVWNLKNEVLLSDGRVLSSPFQSLMAFSQLLEWCKQHNATVFQTHLLAKNNEPLIHPDLAPVQLRERRLLATFTDSDGISYNAIFNIETPYDLSSITYEVMNILESRSMNVHSVVNLDTGHYNILQVYNEDGTQRPEPSGKIEMARAVNLLVFSHTEE